MQKNDDPADFFDDPAKFFDDIGNALNIDAPLTKLQRSVLVETLEKHKSS